MQIKVYDVLQENTSTQDLNEAVFGGEVRSDIMARVVRWQLAKRQAGTHSTKGRSDVRGTTKKPFKQKGTGNARQGSLRGPHFRSGAVAMGPKPRSHAHALTKKVRKLGLRSALIDKLNDGSLVAASTFELSSFKTKDLKNWLETQGWKKVLFIDGETVNETLKKAASNIPNVDVLPHLGANVYDILRKDIVVLSKDALKILEARLA